MKTLNRPFFGLVLLIALCLGLNDDSFAVSFSLEKAQGTWDLRIPPLKFREGPIPGNPACLNDPACTGNRDPNLPPNEIRWGEPAPEGQPKTLENQSGLRYDPPPDLASGPISISENTEHPFGTLTHFNNLVFDPGVESVKLDLLLEISDGSTIHTFDLDLLFAIDETLNAGGDIITLAGITESIDDGDGSKLQIEGFRAEEKGFSAAAALSIISPEGVDNRVNVLAKFEQCQVDCGRRDNGNNAVPEPSTILLLGSGLAGLAAWRRFRGKHRTN